MKKLSSLLLLTSFILLKASGDNTPPVAVNDTVYGFCGYPVQVHLLQNDYDPDGDSIYVYSIPNNCTKINDSTWEVLFTDCYEEYSNDFIFTFLYKIKDINGALDFGTVVFILKTPLPFDSLDISNINARISSRSNHFYDDDKGACFEVPRGSGNMAVILHSTCLLGIDADGTLHSTIRSGGYRNDIEYLPGPVSIVRDTTYEKKWHSLWKLSKQQIQNHIANWNNAGYQPIAAIATWPAHGDVSLGQTANIAPFYDNDNNGIYNPMAGDYPLIRGDQAIFMVFNDTSFTHSSFDNPKMGVEFTGMAYAFDRPDDSLLKNTLFFHYDIINRSNEVYHDTYLGLSADFDLGFWGDDYWGSNVKLGMAYAYNGDVMDGDGQSGSYGEHPPAIGLKVIGGPLMPEDGIDNPAGGCDHSINGLNFGDQIIDNERFGMTNCLNTFNYDTNIMQHGSTSNTYDLLRSIWQDGKHLVFGGNGHPSSGGVGPECRFIFPDKSDTLCNWGTNGVLPNGGYNQNGYYWNETTTGNVPGDRNGIASIGPFTFNAGQSIPLDYCFTFARDYNGDNISSVEKLQDLFANFDAKVTNLITLPETYYSVGETPVNTRIRLTPNPAREWIYVVSEDESAQPYQIFDFSGKYLSGGYLQTGSNQLDIQAFKPGIYLLKSGSRWAKFIKL